MKYKIIIVVLLFPMLAFAQVQQGNVKTAGRPDKKGVPLSDVVVRIKGNYNEVMSNDEGKFSVTMLDYKEGAGFVLSKIYKHGYELCDPGVLGREYVFSSTVPLEIVMVSSEDLLRYKRAIEDSVRTVVMKKYHEHIQKLEKQLAAKSISEESYRKQLQDLRDKLDRNEPLISSMATRYARTDYDRLDSLDKVINQFIEEGELDKADSLIKSKGDVAERIRKAQVALQEQNQGRILELTQEINSLSQNVEIKNVIEDCYRLYLIALSANDKEKAAYYIELRAEIDTQSVEYQLFAGTFLLEHMSDYQKALKYFMRGLKNALALYGENHVDVANSYNLMGLAYYLQKDYGRAIEYYIMTLSIRESVLGENHPDVAKSYENISEVYEAMGDEAKAEEYRQRASSIREKLGK